MRVWEGIRKHWDRLATYGLLSSFGVVSFWRPTPSLVEGPHFFGILFNSEIILAGILLSVSIFYPRFWLRLIGYVIYGIAMLTISGLILVGSGSPIWMLILGFFFMGVMSIRYIAHERRANADLARAAKELEERLSRGT